ncbi:MAG TPA: hypothetical protein VGS78_17195 [Candidatus Sulfotelmatobacter sp.]|nr:hypothetical protein [Candidatus Sulfotelmatobacter sp.]
MSKNPEAFKKHLPESAKHALIRQGEGDTSIALRFAGLSSELNKQGEHVETFDVGPNLLFSEASDGHERIEVAVEHDSLMGQTDEIELSVHVYKDGQEKTLPVIPRLIFTMQKEQDVWRLVEATAAAHIPLTDPDYLAEIRREQDEANESAAQTRVSIIAQAETTFAKEHPDRGYTCALTDLFPPNPNQPGNTLYDYGFANEEYSGYRIQLAGCSGNPSSRYRLSAVPSDSDSQMKTLCVNESGTIKSLRTSKSMDCFRRGDAIQTFTPTAAVDSD